MLFSDDVLEAAPERATKLLTAIGAVATIRTLLMLAGMTDADIEEGRQLLLACLAAPLGEKAASDTEGAQAQRAAVAELDQWDEPNFARFGAALRRRHPDVADYVFRDLAPSTGVVAVKGVATFLLRLDALENGTDPKRQAAKTKKDDQKAVGMLATRGLDKPERTRLHALVQVALGPTAPLPTLTLDEGRREALSELKGWYEEWATTARAVVKKKGDLIRLGLANRKSRAKAEKAAAKKKAAAAKAEEADPGDEAEAKAEEGAPKAAGGAKAPGAAPGNGASAKAPG